MFIWHFDLFEQPFGPAPDARFVYPSRSYREALAALINGIDSGVGFSCLIGDPGLGKTTLLHPLLERYAPQSRVAYFAATECSPQQLFGRILESFELHVEETDVNAMYGAFHDMVVRETSAGKRVILLVDDADTLSASTLDSLRLLSNFELPNPGLVHLVLAGSAHLNDMLAHPELTSLQQLITTSARLLPLTREESAQYIQHRLKAAGAGETPVFTPEAIAFAAEHGNGNPGELNRLGLNAMNLACALRRKQVEENDVRQVLHDLGPQPEPEAIPAPGPVLVSDATPLSTPVTAQSAANYTWGSQALAVAPALENEPEPIAAAAVQEAAPQEAPSAAPPLPPPIEFSDAVRSLRADLLDDSPAPRSSPSRRHISRSIRRIFLVTASVAAILACVIGIALLSRAAWKFFVQERAASQAEADSATPADSTPAAVATKKSKHAPSAKRSSSETQGSSDSALVGTASAAGVSAASAQQHQSSRHFAGYPRNVDEFRIPGMIIIPIPFVRSPYAPPIEPATLQFRVEPIYPADAKAQRVEGTVNIRLHLDRTGHVRTLLVLSGDRRLAKPALAAVRQWVFSPFQESGAPFEGDTTVSLEFMAD